MTNPLLDLRFPLPFDAILPEHVEPAVTALLERAQRAVDRIAEAAEGDADRSIGGP